MMTLLYGGVRHANSECPQAQMEVVIKRSLDLVLRTMYSVHYLHPRTCLCILICGDPNPPQSPLIL